MGMLKSVTDCIKLHKHETHGTNTRMAFNHDSGTKVSHQSILQLCQKNTHGTLGQASSPHSPEPMHHTPCHTMKQQQGSVNGTHHQQQHTTERPHMGQQLQCWKCSSGARYHIVALQSGCSVSNGQSCDPSMLEHILMHTTAGTHSDIPCIKTTCQDLMCPNIVLVASRAQPNHTGCSAKDKKSRSA